jgi:polyisoprenoid-binding protein YceI
MRAALAAVMLLATTACEDEHAQKARAATQARQPALPPALPARPGATTYDFDHDRSSIEFVGTKLSRRHAGKVGTFRGSIQLLGGDATSGAVTVVVEMATLSADDPKLTRHLKSADFLDVERFPYARFTSTAVQAGGPEGATHLVTGNFELRGVTKQLTFPAKIKVMSEAVEVTAEFSILRKDFGVAYDGLAGDLIKNDVLLMIRLEARKS